ncbi:aminotransferase class I/II-fold pyridoxal phosphate-dependent enzyme [Anoxynatronum sibiricum]|uniref:aminotransferase class I/II-fold pyridoxal phosphate-dependent enzyme n=1 Tax=Anoxynatronum sibiricum TaxID=210623 RepID=UPI0031B818FC
MASLSPAIKEKTITINGVSKAYAMTGWRIGYALGPAHIIKGMTDYQGNTTTSPNTPAQYASMEALANSRESVEMMRAEFDRRRKYIIEKINAMEHLSCSTPKGAFYVMPNVSHYYGSQYNGIMINNSLDLANYQLEEANIAVVTEAAFEAPDHIRISYSNSMENIEKGMNRLEEALSKLNP